VLFRVPDSYYGDVNLETGEFVLLLEDLAPAVPFDIVQGVLPDDARTVVRDLARHHAQWWESAKFDRYDWILPFNAQAEGAEEKYQAAFPIFLDKVGDLLPDGIAELGARLLDRIVWVKSRIAAPPITFLHGDFHPNNLLLDGKGDESRLAVVDWQMCSVGQGTRDLMYFITSALLPEHREAHESELLELYHTELVSNGVEGFSLTDVVAGYRFALLDLLQFFTMVIFLLDFEVNDEARAVRDLLIARWGGAIAAHDPGSLLPADKGSGS
jgi:aminoglycoside/choline kinase family phosphotransferase